MSLLIFHFLDSHSPFLKNGLKLLKEKALQMTLNIEELQHKVGLRIAKIIRIIKIASQSLREKSPNTE